MGSWSRFLRGVNQANYFSGDKRFRVNCLEACVAFHQSRELGRQFVAGPAGDRDPAWLVEALGGKARWVADVAGAARYVRSVRVGGDVPVIFQRRDGSAHAVNAVHVRQGVVAVADAQKGEEDASADVVAATGVWVVELPEAGPAAGAHLLATLRNTAISMLRITGHNDIGRATEWISRDRTRTLPVLSLQVAGHNTQ
ncbi:toxin glutamine deamidase domain-containing protein [Saccharopolyspora sp. ASAGF58]|uniref:toxin glutamine deamidase domain-containing protein n=1 Tax=Saccharopolyspora sp. ASAGF58 TaxID=2719023 RepID=UPI00144810C0|nr:toxin glutamine deamidase domain-containing protein [Saccharopolyspora sp. ASAGF58]